MFAVKRGFLVWTGTDREPARHLPGDVPFDPPGSCDYMYRVLQRRVDAKGDGAVPKREIFDGERLGAWVQAVRLRYKTGAPSADRIRRLETLPGWVWRTR
jgi:hypothetical protein